MRCGLPGDLDPSRRDNIFRGGPIFWPLLVSDVVVDVAVSVISSRSKVFFMNPVRLILVVDFFVLKSPHRSTYKFSWVSYEEKTSLNLMKKLNLLIVVSVLIYSTTTHVFCSRLVVSLTHPMCNDLSFTRYLHHEDMIANISYFSYHASIFTFFK